MLSTLGGKKNLLRPFCSLKYATVSNKLPLLLCIIIIIVIMVVKQEIQHVKQLPPRILLI